MKNTISLNKGWTFKKDLPNFQIGNEQQVDVPHNWNSFDGQDGGNDYFRGECEYSKEFPHVVKVKSTIHFYCR